MFETITPNEQDSHLLTLLFVYFARNSPVHQNDVSFLEVNILICWLNSLPKSRCVLIHPTVTIHPALNIHTCSLKPGKRLQQERQNLLVYPVRRCHVVSFNN